MLTINDILKTVKERNPNAIKMIEKSYKLAEYAHQGVYRESGEPYIIHPLNVAKIY